MAGRGGYVMMGVDLAGRCAHPNTNNFLFEIVSFEDTMIPATLADAYSIGRRRYCCKSSAVMLSASTNW